MNPSHSHPPTLALKKRLDTLLADFPLLAGSLVKQYVVCGKPCCRGQPDRVR